MTVCKAASLTYVVPYPWYEMSVSLCACWDANKSVSTKWRSGRELSREYIISSEDPSKMVD